jgi:hypothetical protein
MSFGDFDRRGALKKRLSIGRAEHHLRDARKIIGILVHVIGTGVRESQS